VSRCVALFDGDIPAPRIPAPEALAGRLRPNSVAVERAHTFLYKGGIIEFIKHLNQNNLCPPSSLIGWTWI
jgi:hypothetical protein